jgi:hypothetical protein
MIGGDGVVVEVDEALLVKRKNNMGRFVREQWVFGGYCPSTKEGFCMMYLIEQGKQLSQ